MSTGEAVGRRGDGEGGIVAAVNGFERGPHLGRFVEMGGGDKRLSGCR